MALQDGRRDRRAAGIEQRLRRQHGGVFLNCYPAMPGPRSRRQSHQTLGEPVDAGPYCLGWDAQLARDLGVRGSIHDAREHVPLDWTDEGRIVRSEVHAESVDDALLLMASTTDWPAPTRRRATVTALLVVSLIR